MKKELKPKKMKKSINARFAYPMNTIGSYLSESEIKSLSENYEFNPEDAYFHADPEKGMLESLNEEDINFYNANVPTDKKILVYGAMAKVA